MILCILSFIVKNGILYLPYNNNLYITLSESNETYVMRLPHRVVEELIWNGMYTLITERDVVVISQDGTKIRSKKHMDRIIMGAMVWNGKLVLVFKDEIRILKMHGNRIYISRSISIDKGIYRVSDGKIIKIDGRTEVYELTSQGLKRIWSTDRTFKDCLFHKGKLYGLRHGYLHIVGRKGERKIKVDGDILKIVAGKPVVIGENSIYLIDEGKRMDGKNIIEGEGSIVWRNGKMAFIYNGERVDSIKTENLAFNIDSRFYIFDGKKLYRYGGRETYLTFQIGAFTSYGVENIKRISEFAPIMYVREGDLIKVRIGYLDREYPILKEMWNDGWFVYSEHRPLKLPRTVDLNENGRMEYFIFHGDVLTVWEQRDDKLVLIKEFKDVKNVKVEDIYRNSVILKTDDGWYKLYNDGGEIKIGRL